MKIFERNLVDLGACKEAIAYFEENKMEGKSLKTCIRKALKDGHWDWCNWILLRLMTYENQLKYAIFAIELIIDVYENEYSNDDRPRKAIEAAKTYQKNLTEKNRSAAESAARNARSAARSAWSAADGTWGAAWGAAQSAAWIAESAGNTGSAAESAAESALQIATRSAAQGATRIKIINYGLKILEGEL